MSSNGCATNDLVCQCGVAKQAAIALASGPCVLANCSLDDLTSFTSALTTACASTTTAASAGTSSGASAVQGSSTAAAAAAGLGPLLETGPSEAKPSSGAGQSYSGKLTSGAIAGIAVAGGAVGLLGGVAIYFFAVVRRRRSDRGQWEQLEKEKAAMQMSLEELKQAMLRQETFDTVSSMEEAKGFGRQKSIMVNWKDGPQELMEPERTYHELP